MPRSARLKPSSSKASLATTIATWLTLALTIATLNLTLLGYGYDSAYVDALGLNPEDLQRTPVDFLMRSWRPFMTLIDGLTKFWTLESQLRLWDRFLQDNASLLEVISVLTAVLAYCVQRLGSVRKAIGQAAYYSKNFVHRKCPWLVRGVRFVVNKGAAVLARLKQDRNNRLFGYSGSIISLAIIAIFQVAMATMWFVLVVGALLIAYVPFLGSSTGMTRAKNEVLDPVSCAKHVNPKEIDKNRLANCVKVLRDGRELASGYQVDFSASRVFLFQPCVNSIVSFPLATTTVEHVENLEYEVRDKNCASFAAYQKSKIASKP
jgi:hypothetical protein